MFSILTDAVFAIMERTKENLSGIITMVIEKLEDKDS